MEGTWVNSGQGWSLTPHGRERQSLLCPLSPLEEREGKALKKFFRIRFGTGCLFVAGVAHGNDFTDLAEVTADFHVVVVHARTTSGGVAAERNHLILGRFLSRLP